MSAPTPPETQPDVETSGPSLRMIFSVMGVIVILCGVTAYWRYTVSEAWFARSLPAMTELGKTVNTEGCVDAAVRWHGACDANKPLCDNGVPRAMTHCLMSDDRSETCAEMGDQSASAQWVFKRCADRGTPCKSRKSCPCADAYRALDSFCRHRQEGVAL